MIFFIPTCIVSVIINLKNKNIKLKTACIVSVSGIMGAIIGANISTKLKENNLKKYFGYFLLFIAIFEIYTLIKSNKKVNNKNIK